MSDKENKIFNLIWCLPLTLLTFQLIEECSNWQLALIVSLISYALRVRIVNIEEEMKEIKEEISQLKQTTKCN